MAYKITTKEILVGTPFQTTVDAIEIMCHYCSNIAVYLEVPHGLDMDWDNLIEHNAAICRPCSIDKTSKRDLN
jgi:hypothetical protein